MWPWLCRGCYCCIAYNVQRALNTQHYVQRPRSVTKKPSQPDRRTHTYTTTWSECLSVSKRVCVCVWFKLGMIKITRQTERFGNDNNNSNKNTATISKHNNVQKRGVGQEHHSPSSVCCRTDEIVVGNSHGQTARSQTILG